ncbi:hypothetical protein [Moorena sp. SIO1G6]|nr:hypothetical protein [Moorena sp. SIO1G6]
MHKQLFRWHFITASLALAHGSDSAKPTLRERMVLGCDRYLI